MSDEVVIGPYCVLASENHTRQKRFVSLLHLPAAIIVGHGSWLGAHAIVTAGSKIGQGSLVAAGTVVTGYPLQCTCRWCACTYY